jgi:hypothetical protein
VDEFDESSSNTSEALSIRGEETRLKFETEEQENSSLMNPDQIFRFRDYYSDWKQGIHFDGSDQPQ